MKQKDEFNYTVENDEVVTVVFTPISVGPFAELAVDGTSLEKKGGDTPTFEFTVTKPAGKSHSGSGRCDFPSGTPAMAKYTTKLSGSFGGDFAGPTIFASASAATFSVPVWATIEPRAPSSW